MIEVIRRSYEFGEVATLDFGNEEIPAFAVDNFHKNDEDPYILLVIDDPNYGDPLALIKIYKDRTIIEVDATDGEKCFSSTSALFTRKVETK